MTDKGDMAGKRKRRTVSNFLCALIWAGVACAWFPRARRGTVGTPWFNAVLGLACLATAGVHVYRALRDLSRARGGEEKSTEPHDGGKTT